MLSTTTAIALVKDGSPALSIGQREALATFFQTYEGKFVSLTASVKGKPRSLSQNNRLWKLYEYIGEYSGHTKEEIHAACKEMFLGREFLTVGTHEVQIPKSTKGLSTCEMGEYMDRVTAFAGELGISLPEFL